MKIGFIGAGKVGQAFASYLKKKNIRISGFASRSTTSASIAGELTVSKIFPNNYEVISASDLILITTNDDQIEAVASEIALLQFNLAGKFFAHMSGALSSNSLNVLEEKGATVFSLHPMQSFADHEKSISDLENTTFGVEGKKNLEVITNLLEKIGNPYLLINADQKSEYHIASCIVSNFLTTLLNFGFDILKSIGIDELTAIAALAPMIRGTVENNIEFGPKKALTGPIARGDIQTIKKHIQSLEKNKWSALDTYRFLGKLTLDLAKKEKLSNPDVIQELEDLFS